jgi:hypothetical protein
VRRLRKREFAKAEEKLLRLCYFRLATASLLLPSKGSNARSEFRAHCEFFRYLLGGEMLQLNDRSKAFDKQAFDHLVMDEKQKVRPLCGALISGT